MQFRYISGVYSILLFINVRIVDKLGLYRLQQYLNLTFPSLLCKMYPVFKNSCVDRTGRNWTKPKNYEFSSRKLENLRILLLVSYKSPLMNLVNLRYSEKIILFLTKSLTNISINPLFILNGFTPVAMIYSFH